MKIRNNTGPRTVPWGIPDFGIWHLMTHRSVEHIVPLVGESWRTIPGKGTVVKTDQRERERAREFA